MSSNSQVRVYADGRICVPAPLLREAARNIFAPSPETGDPEIPNKVWIACRGQDTVVSWDKLADGIEYDLSVRERVLFGSFPRNKVFSVQVFDNGSIIIFNTVPFMRRDTTRKRRSMAKAKAKTKTKAKTAKPSTAKPKAKRSRPASKSDTSRQIRAEAVSILVDRYPQLTLTDLARYMPEVTVGELLQS